MPRSISRIAYADLHASAGYFKKSLSSLLIPYYNAAVQMANCGIVHYGATSSPDAFAFDMPYGTICTFGTRKRDLYHIESAQRKDISHLHGKYIELSIAHHIDKKQTDSNRKNSK